MASEMQRAALEKLVEQGGKSVSKAMRESKRPYSPRTAQTPKKLTESKGFKELMGEYGLTEGLITRALVSDIKAKPRKRFLELSLGAEILSMKKRGTSETSDRPQPILGVQVNIQVNNVSSNIGNPQDSGTQKAD